MVNSSFNEIQVDLNKVYKWKYTSEDIYLLHTKLIKQNHMEISKYLIHLKFAMVRNAKEISLHMTLNQENLIKFM